MPKGMVYPKGKSTGKHRGNDKYNPPASKVMDNKGKGHLKKGSQRKK